MKPYLYGGLIARMTNIQSVVSGFLEWDMYFLLTQLKVYFRAILSLYLKLLLVIRTIYYFPKL